MKVVNINLSGITDEILISICFPWGYLNEDDSNFGLTHLIEHYLVSVLEKRYEPIYIDATIDNTETVIHFSFKKESKIDPTKIMSDINGLISEIDLDILKNEKKRIEIELEEKYSDILNEISYSIESKVIDAPERLKRYRLEQIKNIRSFKEKDIIDGVNKLLKLDAIIFVGYDGNKDDDLNLDIPYKPDISLISKKQFKLKSKNKIIKKLHNFTVVFPLPKIIDDLNKYYSFKFISEYFNIKLSDKILDLGVYKTEYDYQFGKNSGYIWYFFNGYKKLEISLNDVVENILIEIKNDNDLDRNIVAFKEKTIKELQFNWDDFYGRFDWAVDDYISKGHIDDLETTSNVIKNLSSIDILNMLDEVFSLDTIIVSK